MKVRSKKSTNVRTVVFELLRDGIQGLERLSPTLAAAGAEGLFLTPWRPHRPSREQALLGRATPLPLSVHGETIAAWSWGQGAPIALVHGWQGRGTQLGAFIEPLVERGHRVIAFDVRAHGDSPGRQATLLEFRDALIAAASVVGPLRGVIAHSFGAAGVWCALASGVSVDRLVLIAPVARLEGGIRRFAEGMLGLERATADRVIDRVERRTDSPLPLVEPLEIAPKVEADALIIHDRGDREVSFSDGELLAAACKRAKLLPTEGLGHARVLSDPEVALVAADFIAGDESRLRAALEMRTMAPEAARLDRYLFRRDQRNLAPA
jgi:pimeloyl-ACP methyl ester carboxylesterase